MLEERFALSPLGACGSDAEPVVTNPLAATSSHFELFSLYHLRLGNEVLGAQSSCANPLVADLLAGALSGNKLAWGGNGQSGEDCSEGEERQLHIVGVLFFARLDL
jgi:hypothetical protein